MADDFDLDLGPAVREAILGLSAIAGQLSTYNGEPAVFTRRPVPDEATYPLIIIDQTNVRDEDGLNSDRPVVEIDVKIYGDKAEPGSEDDDTRIVEQMGTRTRLLFHRERWSLDVGGFHVIDVTALGPAPAPVDDDKTVGRSVSLTVKLRRGN